jgi:hypothetical protein
MRCKSSCIRIRNLKPGDVKKLKSIADNIVELSLNGLSLSEERYGNGWSNDQS